MISAKSLVHLTSWSVFSGLVALSGYAGNFDTGGLPLKYKTPRRSPHLLWTAPVVISAGGIRHVGLVRDVSAEGIGVFSDFRPEPGSELELTIRVPRSTASVRCAGKVVRLDSSESGGATLIGIRLDEYKVIGVSRRNQHASIAEALKDLCRSHAEENR